jgi:hypothetical protein
MPADNSLGEALIEAGWRQGSVASAPSICFGWNALSTSDTEQSTSLQTRRVRAREKLVIVSQTCDIKARPSDEPYVEALICTNEKPSEYLDRIDRNSARAFVVNPATGLVAHAKYRVQLAKAVLQELRPEPWPSDETRFQRFVRWLGRRYDRPALPDAVVEAFQWPVEAVLGQLDEHQPAVSAAFSRAVHEVRLSIPASETPPFEIDMTMLIRDRDLSAEEDEALDAVEEAIRAGLDPTQARLGAVDWKTMEEMSLAQYFASRPLFLEYLTYEGDEEEGAEPLGRA